jgi:hypothetical protein
METSGKVKVEKKQTRKGKIDPEALRKVIVRKMVDFL